MERVARRLLFVVLAGVSIACADQDVAEHVQQLASAGQIEEARRELQNELDRDPNQPDLQLLYGRLLKFSGDYYLAEWPLRKAAEDPEYEDAANRLLAEVLLGSNNAPGAVVVIDQVIEGSPDDISALEFRSRARLASVDAEGGLEDAERVIEFEPGHARAQITRLHALLLLERAEEVEEVLADLRSRADEDPNAFDVGMRGRLCALECRFRLEKGEAEAAFETVKACLEEFPADKRVIAEASTHFAARRDYSALRAMLEKAVELAPDELELRTALASQLRVRGETAEAEALLREGIERRAQQRPADWRALYEHFWAVKDYTGAVSALEAALSLMARPGTLDLLSLADAQIQIEDYEAAAQTAEGLGEGYRDLIEGRIGLERGDLQTAIQSLKRGLQVWPNNATARVLLGEAEAREGKLERALVEYLEAYRIEYGNNGPEEKSDSALRVAHIQAAMGIYEGALDFAYRHMHEKPMDIEATELVIAIAARGGNTELIERALKGMAQIPGEAGRAVMLHAELVEAASGTKDAIEAIESWGLDLTRPVHFRALEALSLLHQQDDPLVALALVERAISARADVPEFEALRGRLLAGIPGREVEARAALERALALAPAHAAAHLGLARMHIASGELQSAIEAYDAAALADPEDAAIQVEAAERIAKDPARRTEARARLEDVLGRHPLYTPAARALALLYMADSPDTALSHASRAAAYSGMLERREAARNLETLGRVQLVNGAIDEAIVTLGQAVELDAELASAQEQLDVARETLKHQEAERGES